MLRGEWGFAEREAELSRQRHSDRRSCYHPQDGVVIGFEASKSSARPSLLSARILPRLTYQDCPN
jgi:hypothetical protein